MSSDATSPGELAPSADATQTTASGLFLRRSSGLVREFGGWDVFVFNTLGYALGLVLAIIPLLMAGAVPEANVLLTVVVGTVFTVANALTYGYLSAAMPRSGGETYSSIIASAHDAGYVNEPSTLSALILAIPVGYYIYIGFPYSSYIGGEVKEPGRTQPRIIVATLAFAAAMYLVCLWRFYDIVGKEFVNSVVYLNNNTDDGSGLPVDPVLNLFVGIMTGNTILNVIMALSFFLWNFLLLFVIATIITRNLFAWSVDRILPDAVTNVDRRFHSPWVATLIVIVASEILLVLYVFTTFFQQVSNYIVL